MINQGEYCDDCINIGINEFEFPCCNCQYNERKDNMNYFEPKVE